MFKQNLEQFFTSKTNWIGMITVAGSLVAMYQGAMTFTEFMQVSGPMLAAMGIRDAI